MNNLGVANMNTLIRSVDGYVIPTANERGIYWPHLDYTDVYFAGDFSPAALNIEDEYGGSMYRAEILLPR